MTAGRGREDPAHNPGMPRKERWRQLRSPSQLLTVVQLLGVSDPLHSHGAHAGPEQRQEPTVLWSHLSPLIPPHPHNTFLQHHTVGQPHGGPRPGPYSQQQPQVQVVPLKEPVLPLRTIASISAESTLPGLCSQGPLRLLFQGHRQLSFCQSQRALLGPRSPWSCSSI